MSDWKGCYNERHLLTIHREESPLSVVSVITRTKNRPLLLRRALRSVLAQTFEDWTQVIINDGGDPALVEDVIAPFRTRYGERLRLVHNPTSVGMEAASNLGLQASEGRYVVIHDDDDSWHPDFLARCVDHLAACRVPSVRGVITWAMVIHEQVDGEYIIPVSESSFNSWQRHLSLYRMAASNTFPPISFLYERAVLEEIGGYRADLPVLGDWEFNLRFMARYDIDVIPIHLAFYHHRVGVREGDLSNSVIGASDDHAYQRVRLLNHLLRKELSEGRFGIAALGSLAHSFDILHQTDNEFRGRFDTLAAALTEKRGWFRWVSEGVPQPERNILRRLYHGLIPVRLRLFLRDVRVRLLRR